MATMLDAFAGVELDEAKFLELLKKVRLYVDARTCGAVPVYLWQFNLVSLARSTPCDCDKRKRKYTRCCNTDAFECCIQPVRLQ